MQRIFTGEVIRGNGRGRALGFPTANMSIVSETPIPQGIWASWCRLREDLVWRQAALHVGPRPTFGDQQIAVELHILDFEDRDLYGEDIDFTLEKRVRDVMEFSSEEALGDAIAADCKTARRLLVSPP